MLYVTAIQPTGMLSFGPSELIPLNENKFVNLTGVNEDKNGDSNGAGKTSFFNSICRILFGEDPTGVKSDKVSNTLWGHGYAGRLEFISWENIPYRITDCRDWKEGNYYPNDNDNQAVYKGTKLFLDRWDGSRWVDCQGKGILDTRKIIIRAIGMSYSRFLAISYMSHRVGDLFLRGDDKDRMDVLSGVSGVEAWDRKAEDFRNRRKPVNKEIADKTQSLSYKEGQLAMLQQQLEPLLTTDWNAVILQATKAIGTLHGNIEAAQKIVSSIQARYNLAVNDANPPSSNIYQNRQELVRQQATLRVQSESPLPETDDIKAFRAEISRLNGVKSSYSGEVGLATLEKCPTCGHKVTKAQKDRITKKVEDAETDLAHQQSLLNGALIQLSEENKTQKTEILGQIVNLSNQIDQIDQQVAQIDAARVEAGKKISLISGELNAANAELNNFNYEKVRLEGQLTQYDTKKGEVVKAQAAVAEATNGIDSLKVEIETLQAEVAVYDWFIQNIPYIKLHKLSLTMKLLSDRTNHYFEDMGDTTRIKISPFNEKQKKKGADLKDLLKGEVNVEITDGDKNIDPRLYSDGETSKISNALIRALHDMATSNGHGCNLIMLDEIFSFVDTNNSQKLAESFYSNLSKGITLITDNSGVVQNLMNFDETWVARKKNGITTIERP